MQQIECGRRYEGRAAPGRSAMAKSALLGRRQSQRRAALVLLRSACGSLADLVRECSPRPSHALQLMLWFSLKGYAQSQALHQVISWLLLWKADWLDQRNVIGC